MLQIPDAPWIREAELYGPPTAPEVCCPVCGRECNEIYVYKDSDAVGCEHCVKSWDAYDWYADNNE